MNRVNVNIENESTYNVSDINKRNSKYYTTVLLI